MECDYCTFKTPAPYEFLKHLKRSHSSRKNIEITCCDCLKVCFSIKKYQSHLYRFHNSLETSSIQMQEQENKNNLFYCNHCNINFVGLHEIKKHVRCLLRSGTPAKCPSCTVIYDNLNSFNNHNFRAHTIKYDPLNILQTTHLQQQSHFFGQNNSNSLFNSYVIYLICLDEMYACESEIYIIMKKIQNGNFKYK